MAKINPQQLKAMTKEWAGKLADSGFVDIEDRNGNLKQYDRRAAAFQDREQVLDYFLKLDAYLETNQNIKPRDRKILTLYTNGAWIKDIVKQIKVDHKTVYTTIKAHEKNFIG